jgi:hypothetical protein
MTETEPIPNLIVGDSERASSMSKKGKGLWQPKSELPPKRIAMQQRYGDREDWLFCYSVRYVFNS